MRRFLLGVAVATSLLFLAAFIAPTSLAQSDGGRLNPILRALRTIGVQLQQGFAAVSGDLGRIQEAQSQTLVELEELKEICEEGSGQMLPANLHLESGPPGICFFEDGSLLLDVINFGPGVAPPSTLGVVSVGYDQDFAVPTLFANSFPNRFRVLIPDPPFCVDDTCFFRAIADRYGVVPETSTLTNVLEYLPPFSCVRFEP